MARNLEEAKKPALTGSLARLTKEELSRRDLFGRTILHLLILANRNDLLKHLFKNIELKKILFLCDYENGWNCLHYIIFYKRLTSFTLVVDLLANNSMGLQTTGLYELMKCKDRNRNTPMQLMGNDFKDFLSIPDYIDEKDEIYSRYRYDGGDSRKHFKPWWNPKRCGSHLYVYGSNINNTLGVEDGYDKSIPSRVLHRFFRSNISKLLDPRYRQVCISKNHSLVVTKEGEVYSCGIGSRGRLGHGMKHLQNTFTFKLIKYFDGEEQSVDDSRKAIRETAISNNHCIALSSSNEVYTWGLNDFAQLGPISTHNSSPVSSEVFDATPRRVASGDLKRNTQHIRGVDVSNIHSLAFTKNDIYFWGLNIGQMGFVTTPGVLHECRIASVSYKGVIQELPRKVTLREDLKLVKTCETCTCVVTTNDEIHIYYQNQHFKLPRVPVKGQSNFDVFKPTALTQVVSIEKICMRSHQTIALLLGSGDITSFSLLQDIRNLKYTYVWKSYDLDMRAVDMDVAEDGSIVVCTRNGSVFMRSNQPRLRKNSVAESSVSSTKNKFKRLECLNRVMRVCCDSQFMSFAFIRDEVDSLPFKMVKSDFFIDMEYLSELCDGSITRKQDQLLSERDEDSFLIDFFDYDYSRRTKALSLMHEEEEEEDEEQACDDYLYLKYSTRYDNNKPIKAKFLYRSLETFKLKVPLHTNSLTLSSDKHYDFWIQINHQKIGIHRAIFEARSAFFDQIFHEDVEISEEGIEGYVDTQKSVLVLTNVTEIRSILVFCHFIYTNRILSFWDDYSLMACPPDIRRVKSEFESLLRMSKLGDGFGSFSKQKAFCESICSLIDTPKGDFVVKLKDGELRCYLPILMARSALFETLLSDRWDRSSSIVLEEVSVKQFEVVLRHLHGMNDLLLFNKLQETSDSKDTFTNEILELIEVADHLLLFDLKSLCQLAIKDMITLNNVFILVLHAHYLNASKLFKSCCWFIYNNLEILIFDPSMRDLPADVLRKVEKLVLFFHEYKLRKINGIYKSITPLGAFFESKSTALISQFLYDEPAYKENFMSDKRGFSAFEPLIDVKLDVKLKDRKKSRTYSKSSIVKDISDFRKSVQETTNQSEKTNEAKPDSAIDDEFEVVGRRKSLYSKPLEVDSLKAQLEEKPELGSKKEKPRLKGTISKVSQKERKRMANGINDATPPARPSGPRTSGSWSAAVGGASSSESSESIKPPNYVRVSSSNPWRKPSDGYPVLETRPCSLSLNDVMLQETLKVEEAKVRELEGVRLDDIQREQEFAKWWEEETARVQRELNGDKKKPDMKKKKKRSDDRKRKEKGRREDLRVK